MAEMWDVYDKNRRKMGYLHERGKPFCEGEYHLVIHVWVKDPTGRFLLTKRAADKYPFPGRWECTGGSALAGETSEMAALRETWEETGLDHHSSSRKILFSYTRHDWHGDVWLFEMDHTPSSICLQQGETTDAVWEDKDTILAMYHDGRFCAYDYLEELLPMM